jgi:type III secretion system YscQ/HrcQ family protein
MNNAFIAKLPQNLARLNNRLAGRDIAVPLSGQESETAFTLRLETSGLEFPAGNFWPENTAAQTHFILEANGEHWKITAWGQAAETLLAPPDGLNPEDIPTELHPALLAMVLEPLLEQASRALGHTFRLASSQARAELENSPQEHFILPFTLTDSTGRPAGAGHAHIPLSAAALSALADLAKLFPRRRTADCFALQLSLSLCAGRESFPLKILRQAAPGDVLLLSSPAKPALTLEANGRPLWKASLADGKITILGALNLNPEETAMNATPETAGNHASGAKASGLSQADIDSLEITLALELDERRMSLGELAALASGQILDTTASMDTPVTIKAGGKAIGKGRLVEVGDRLGVLIASLDLGTQDRGVA